jgi:hypothetical protein
LFVVSTATTYHIHVKTGEVSKGGTDANVFLKIFGTKADTDTLWLKSSESGGNKFEKGRTDVFKIDATDIGKVTGLLLLLLWLF